MRSVPLLVIEFRPELEIYEPEVYLRLVAALMPRQAGHRVFALKGSLFASHEPPLLRAIVTWVIVMRRPSRRSHVQLARVDRQDGSTLTRNSDKRSVIVNATPPVARVNGTGTSGHLKE